MSHRHHRETTLLNSKHWATRSEFAACCHAYTPVMHTWCTADKLIENVDRRISLGSWVKAWGPSTLGTITSWSSVLWSLFQQTSSSPKQVLQKDQGIVNHPWQDVCIGSWQAALLMLSLRRRRALKSALSKQECPKQVIFTSPPWITYYQNGVPPKRTVRSSPDQGYL